MRIQAVAVIATIALISCQPSTEVLSSTEDLSLGIGPLCQAGCVETDPNPSAPGVFLGSSVTGELCGSVGQTDHDDDGLSTFCEEHLADAFAPGSLTPTVWLEGKLTSAPTHARR